MRRPKTKPPVETPPIPLPEATHNRMGIPVRQYLTPAGNDCHGNSKYTSVTLPAFGIRETDRFRRDGAAHVATREID